MSRYLILFLLNIPFITVAIINEVVRFKLERSRLRHFVARMVFWGLILLGLASSKFIYEWLFSHDLTVSESLSLFDVIQLTAIIFLFSIVTRQMNKLSSIEAKLRNLHENISIKFSEKP